MILASLPKVKLFPLKVSFAVTFEITVPPFEPLTEPLLSSVPSIGATSTTTVTFPSSQFVGFAISHTL